MYRQSPVSRNQRSKGIKVKYVLQICLLLAVCLWLIYQVKHSHDKKKEFEETDAKASLQRQISDEILRLGRKDIVRPRDDQPELDEKLGEPIEEEDVVEEDENKPEEDEPEGKNVEEKDDSNNVKDEQENSDAEADREEDSIDENDNQELVVSEDEHGQTERRGSVAEVNETTHEARDENYKADDASSAVTHETNQTGGVEKENERTEYSDKRTEDVLEENKENNSDENNTGEERKDLELGNGEIGVVDRESNITSGESKVDVLDSSENGSPPRNNITMDRDLTSNNVSSEFNIEKPDSSETKTELDHVSTDGFDSNSSGFVETKDAKLQSEDLSNSRNNKTESSTEKKDVVETEESDITDGTYENSVTVNPEEQIQHDVIDESDASNSMEEKHVRTDLDTLPEIRTEGTNSDDDDDDAAA